MKKLYFATLIVLAPFMIMVILFGCSKDDDVIPEKPKVMIRLQTGDGLRDGGTISFLALSKNCNFADLSTEETFEYDKTTADWYIDGDIIPFTTPYKEFTKPIGEYYYIMNSPNVCQMSKLTVKSGSQSILIYGDKDGFLRIELK
jgi:hypothetical protein